MVGTSHYALHVLFSDLNWFLTIRVEYLSLSLSMALFVPIPANSIPMISSLSPPMP